MKRGAALAAALLGAAPAPAAEGDGFHVVQTGESLSVIAAERLRNQGCWPEIYRANRDQIKDPSILHPGQRLVIPADLDCEPKPGTSESED